jgi:hypothetical protein
MKLININEIKATARIVIRDIGYLRLSIPFIFILLFSVFDLFFIPYELEKLGVTFEVVQYSAEGTSIVTPTILGFLINAVTSCLLSIVFVGYFKMIVVYLRTKVFAPKVMFTAIAQLWSIAFVCTLTTSLISSIGIAMFIIPGIVSLCAFSPLTFVLADEQSKLKVTSVLQRCLDISKGYKLTIFITAFSFLGSVMIYLAFLNILTLNETILSLILSYLTSAGFLFYFLPYSYITMALLFIQIVHEKSESHNTGEEPSDQEF